MFAFIEKICFFNIYQKKKLKLSDFQEFRFVIYDNHSKLRDNIWLCYFDKNNQLDEINDINKINVNSITTRDKVNKIAHKSIGYISYRPNTGQIGLFFIDKKYRQLSLGTQILFNIIKELTNNNKQTQIWAVTTISHPFWSNVFDKSFEFATRPHESVLGSGYLLNLLKFNEYKEEHCL